MTVSHELGIDEESLHNVLVQHLPSLYSSRTTRATLSIGAISGKSCRTSPAP